MNVILIFYLFRDYLDFHSVSIETNKTAKTRLISMITIIIKSPGASGCTLLAAGIIKAVSALVL